MCALIIKHRCISKRHVTNYSHDVTVVLPRNKYGVHDIVDDVARSQRSLEVTKFTEVIEVTDNEVMTEHTDVLSEDVTVTEVEGEVRSDYVETTWM